MGVIDIEGNDISSTEIMSHALGKVTKEQEMEDYIIRRGSAFVNEYSQRDTVTGLRNDGGPSDPNHQNHPSEALRQDMRRLEKLNSAGTN